MTGPNDEPAKYPASLEPKRAGSAPEPPFDEVWDRIKHVTGIKNQSQLAEVLEIKTPSVTGAKQRGFFPLAWAYKIAWTYNASLDFILFGRETGNNECVVDLEKRKLLYIDPAVQLVEEAVKESGVSINQRQKAAVIEIVREELKKMTVQMLLPLKRGSNDEGSA